MTLRFRPWPRTPQAAVTVHYLALLLIVVIGAYLRLTALARQSLWFDEIDVVVRAQRPFSQVLHTFVAAGENGPLYNVLLAVWVRLAGISEIAVRLPSAVAGVLSIPLIYLLGRRLVSANAGLLAAGLLAISPYHLWYSQEAKMYTLVVLLALVSTLTLVEALGRNQRWWWAAYALSTTLMFYSHVATVLVFAAQSAYVVLTYRQWRTRTRGWLVAVAVLTLPYVPIALWAIKVIGGEVATWQPDVSLWEATRILGIKFAVNRADPDTEQRGALLYLLLASLGVGVLLWRRRPQRWWLLLLALVLVPTGGLWVLSLRQSVFSDRYAIVALPAYLTLVATSSIWLLRRRLLWPLGVLAVFMLLMSAWVPIRDVNRSSQAQKEDWRSAYADIATRVEPGDALIVHPGYLVTTWEYFRQRDPVLAQHPVVTIPTFQVGWLSKPLMIKMIHDQAPQATRFWLIQSPIRVPPEDPDHTLEHWLAESGTLEYEHEVNGVRVTLYQLPAPIVAP